MDDARVSPLWRGRPDPLGYLLREAWPAAAIGLLAAAIATAWEVLSLTGGYRLVYPLTGLLFVVVALHGLVLRPLLLWATARDLEYSLDARALRLVRRRSGRVMWQISTAELPPFAVVPVGTRGRCADVVLFGVPPIDTVWGWWRLVDVRSRLSCLSAADAAAASAALETLCADPGVVRPRAWARGLTTPQGIFGRAYDPRGAVDGAPDPGDAPAQPASPQAP